MHRCRQGHNCLKLILEPIFWIIVTCRISGLGIPQNGEHFMSLWDIFCVKQDINKGHQLSWYPFDLPPQLQSSQKDMKSSSRSATLSDLKVQKS